MRGGIKVSLYEEYTCGYVVTVVTYMNKSLRIKGKSGLRAVTIPIRWWLLMATSSTEVANEYMVYK